MLRPATLDPVSENSQKYATSRHCRAHKISVTVGSSIRIWPRRIRPAGATAFTAVRRAGSTEIKAAVALSQERLNFMESHLYKSGKVDEWFEGHRQCGEIAAPTSSYRDKAESAASGHRNLRIDAGPI